MKRSPSKPPNYQIGIYRSFMSIPEVFRSLTCPVVQWCSVETVGMTKPDQQLISLAYLFHIKVASYFQFVGPIKFQMIELQRCWNDTSHFISLVWGIMSGIRFPSVPRPMLPVKPSASCHRVIFTDTGYLRSSIQLILTFIYNVRHNYLNLI